MELRVSGPFEITGINFTNKVAHLLKCSLGAAAFFFSICSTFAGILLCLLNFPNYTMISCCNLLN